MLLEHGWFKNKDEQKSLQDVITNTTSERTEDIIEHQYSQQEAIRLLEDVGYQIDLIDQKIQITASNSLEEDSLSSLKKEFEETVLCIATELHLYGAVNRSFQPMIDEYQKVSNSIMETLDIIESKDALSDELAQQWQENKKIFLDLSEKITIELKDTLDTIQSLPQVYN